MECANQIVNGAMWKGDAIINHSKDARILKAEQYLRFAYTCNVMLHHILS